MASEIDAIRALLTSKPRPVGWAERRARIEEVGAIWPVAGDIRLESVDLGGVAGEWSLAPGTAMALDRARAVAAAVEEQQRARRIAW